MEVKGKIVSTKFPALVDIGFDLYIAFHHQEAAKLGLEIDHYTWVRYADRLSIWESTASLRRKR